MQKNICKKCGRQKLVWLLQEALQHVGEKQKETF